MPFRVEIKVCPTCDGKQRVHMGVTDKGKAIWVKCSACGGRGLFKAIYQSDMVVTDPEAMFWIIPWHLV